MGKSPMNGGFNGKSIKLNEWFSIAMFDYQKVSELEYELSIKHVCVLIVVMGACIKFLRVESWNSSWRRNMT